MNDRNMPSGRSQRLADSKDVLFVAFESNSNYKSNSDTGVLQARLVEKYASGLCEKNSETDAHFVDIVPLA
jgi:hypothetical protein